MYKILNVIDSLNPSQGGPVRSVIQLSNNLNSYKDFNASIICNDKKHYDNIENLKIFFFKKINFLKVRKFLNNFQIIHFHGIWSYNHLILCLFCVIFKKKFIIQPRGMLEPWSLSYKKFKKKICLIVYQKFLLKRAKFLIATSEMEKNNLLNLKFNNNVIIIPNAINLPVNNFKKKNYFNTTLDLLFLSRVHKKKGIENLIIALYELNKTFKEWSLKIVGPVNINYKKNLKKKISEFCLSNKIIFYDEVNDIEKIEYYLKSDIFVLPSYSENFGLVIAESLSYKTPVITTIHTPWQDLNEKKCGWCVNNDIGSLISILREVILINRNELNILGENGYNYISKFDWSYIKIKFRNLYLDIIN